MFLTNLVPTVPVTQMALGLGLLWALLLGGRIIYNIYWHPLSNFPGPKLHVSTFLPYYWTKWLGTETLSIKKIHEKHGHVVRINPNTLSFTTAQSWKDIYGLRSGRVQLPKVDVIAEKGYPRHLAATIDDAQHARARGLLSPAFSERAIREQESLIMKYVDLLIQRLKSQVLASMGGEVDLVRWYNFTTFDIVGDLSLGEPFGSLESGEYHVWITDIFKGLKNVILLRIVTAYPILEAILTCLVKLYPKVLEGQRVHRENTKVALQKRLATKTERKDFISYFPHELTGDELNSNAMMLLLAGSETSATLLSGATYYLLTNKSALDKLCNEVRSTFQSESEITFTSVARLRYLNAVIEESFRLYPPVPGVLGRRTLPEGNVIDGQYIPGNTVVGIYQLVAYKSKYNFRHPDKFIPERWLDEPLYADDQRAVLQPFSTGPRNCLGRTLAYAEIRTILASMLWHFDMELCEASKGWTNQLAFLLWEKPALMVKLKERDFAN